MVQEFEEVAFGLNKNEITKPFKSRFGYLILKITGKKPEKQLSFSSQKTKKILDGIIEENRLSAKIEYAK